MEVFVSQTPQIGWSGDNCFTEELGLSWTLKYGEELDRQQMLGLGRGVSKSTEHRLAGCGDLYERSMR